MSPNLSIWSPHPVGWVNPVTMRASAALPAAGAWDATPTEQNVAGAEAMVLSLTYTRGAVGGAFDFQVEYSLYSLAANAPAGAEEWSDESVLAPGAVVVNVDTMSNVQENHTRYGATGAAAEAFVFGPVVLSNRIERVRIRCREQGDVDTPGTLQITAELW